MKTIMILIPVVFLILPATIGSASEQRMKESVEGYVLTEMVGGAKKWTLKAEKAHTAEANTVEAEGLKFLYFPEDGSHIQLTAKRGSIDLGSRDFQADGNVVVSRGDMILKAKTLCWKASDRKIVGPEGARILLGRSVIEGSYLEAYTEKRELFLRKAQGRVYLKGLELEQNE